MDLTNGYKAKTHPNSHIELAPRLWRFQRKNINGKEIQSNDHGELKLKEEVIKVSAGLQLSVSLESVLAGHEDKVFGLRWQNEPNRYELNFCRLQSSN